MAQEGEQPRRLISRQNPRRWTATSDDANRKPPAVVAMTVVALGCISFTLLIRGAAFCRIAPGMRGRNFEQRVQRYPSGASDENAGGLGQRVRSWAVLRRDLM